MGMDLVLLSPWHRTFSAQNSQLSRTRALSPKERKTGVYCHPCCVTQEPGGAMPSPGQPRPGSWDSTGFPCPELAPGYPFWMRALIQGLTPFLEPAWRRTGERRHQHLRLRQSKLITGVRSAHPSLWPHPHPDAQVLRGGGPLGRGLAPSAGAEDTKAPPLPGQVVAQGASAAPGSPCWTLTLTLLGPPCRLSSIIKSSIIWGLPRPWYYNTDTHGGTACCRK